jgi:ATP-binding cassette subfamily F protein 3
VEGKPLFNNVNLSINTDSRICLVGPNGKSILRLFFFFVFFWETQMFFSLLGVGKSTLLKIIYQELKSVRGVVSINNKIRMERFSQHHVDQLNLKKSALEQFKFDWPTDPVQKIRSHLGSMGISGKLALQPIYTVLKDSF